MITSQDYSSSVFSAKTASQTDLALVSLRKTLDGFLECAGYMKDAERGFDLYVTEDGVHFETITTNGFNDPYNHGLRTFASTEDGLMIGTANPFYAAQVWLLTDGNGTENSQPSFWDILNNVFGPVFNYLFTAIREVMALLTALF